MYTIYALKFNIGRIYVGTTGNFKQRIADHKRDHVKSTKNRGEFEITIIEENVPDRETARIREKYWKSGCGKEQLKVRGGSSIG